MEKEEKEEEKKEEEENDADDDDDRGLKSLRLKKKEIRSPIGGAKIREKIAAQGIAVAVATAAAVSPA